MICLSLMCLHHKQPGILTGMRSCFDAALVPFAPVALRAPQTGWDSWTLAVGGQGQPLRANCATAAFT